MIYMVQYKNRKPQRIADDYAHDFYQMWHGNLIGQNRYNDGDYCTCPRFPQLRLWGEDFEESTWFKKSLQGVYADGFFDVEELLTGLGQ